MTKKKPDLETAYALQSPADNVALYADWAGSYDSEFAENMNYRLPMLVALVCAEHPQLVGPVLDVGAGTGLLTLNIPMRSTLEIDGLDISPQMLAVAQRKGLYRNAIVADLTQPLEIADQTYRSVVSSGTFTHGHVGPDAMDELLRIAKRGALFVLAINATHFVARGFEAKFAALAQQIDNVQHQIVQIYGPGADAAHRDDTAQIAIFTKR